MLLRNGLSSKIKRINLFKSKPINVHSINQSCLCSKTFDNGNRLKINFQMELQQLEMNKLHLFQGLETIL
jgi:hypothetical protein